MDRRSYLKAIAAVGVAPALPLQAAGKPIHLHVDLEVEASREQEMVNKFHTIFEPVISKQPGFVGVEMLKLRSALVGDAPTSANYKLVIIFETEEQRMAWVATDDHQRVWPSIEKTLTGFKFNAILYDRV
ncbi:MAG: hypothetical protein GY953_16150 [bacterium]|nr:hypothetical protein [bacterium]